MLRIRICTNSSRRINNNASKDAKKIGVAGTGFFIASDTLVTNIHVVALAKTVAAKQIKVTRIPVYLPDHKDLPYAYKKSVCKDPVLYTITGVIAFDAKNDLVLLKVAEKCDAPLCLGNSENVKVGDRVGCVKFLSLGIMQRLPVYPRTRPMRDSLTNISRRGWHLYQVYSIS